MSTPIPPAMADGGQLELEWDDPEGFPPGAQLATFLSSEKNRLADLTDGELLEVAAAARRRTSWAQARELAAIGELTRRRTAEEETGDPDYRILSARESVTEEVAAALTLTGNTAATLVHLAEQLTGPLSRTGQALETGRVDLAKARVICDVTDHLPAHTTQRLQDAALEKAQQQTTGQLRRRLRRIAQRLAPQAIEERRREAVRRRRLEVWDTPSGTSDLALCDLTAEDAHAIYNKITAAANGIKADGDPRPLTIIRADLATQLLHGAQLPQAIRTLLTTTPQPAEQHTAPPPTFTRSAIVATTAPHAPVARTSTAPAASIEPAVPGATASPATIAPDTHAPPTLTTRATPTGPMIVPTGADIAPYACALTTLAAAPEPTVRVALGQPENGPAPLLGQTWRVRGASPAMSPTTGSESTPSNVHDLTARVLVPATAPTTPDVHDALGQEKKDPALGLSEAHADGGGSAGAASVEDVTPREDQALAALVVMVGRELHHVRARVHPKELPRAIAHTVERIAEQLAPVRNSACQGTDDVHGSPGYRPPAALRREVQARHATCVFPSCNQPSHRSDLDHTVPWRPGTTCRCNLAPLCRRHHRTKQSPGWKLHQIWPGLLVWVTPSGAWYIVRPDRR
ncbi:protein of uncharacterised function DUF222 [Mycobacterium tuberculosis]|nr:protein of uncharacterised function DUF222 [Mycobacterium tuberculosis]